MSHPFTVVAMMLMLAVVVWVAIAESQPKPEPVDLLVHVFRDTATTAGPRANKRDEAHDVGTIPFEPSPNTLHVFCNARRGHLIYIFRDQLAVVRDGCKGGK